MIKKVFAKISLGLLFTVLLCMEASAMTAPGAGMKFKFISDLVVNDVVQGPIGYSLATLSAVFSAGMLIMSKIMPAVGGIVGTAVMIGAPMLVESAGAVII